MNIIKQVYLIHFQVTASPVMEHKAVVLIKTHKLEITNQRKQAAFTTIISEMNLRLISVQTFIFAQIGFN